MYVFGGKDEDSEKLNDLWVFNLAEKRWVEIEAQGDIPFERSGHSSDVFDGHLVIFGGIWDVTKELNDLHLYNFAENNWTTIIEPRFRAAPNPRVRTEPLETTYRKS